VEGEGREGEARGKEGRGWLEFAPGRKRKVGAYELICSNNCCYARDWIGDTHRVTSVGWGIDLKVSAKWARTFEQDCGRHKRHVLPVLKTHAHSPFSSCELICFL